MTAKILMRQSFSRTTNYVFKDGRAEVIASRGILVTDPLAAASSFNASSWGEAACWTHLYLLSSR